jgi:serine/threonine protein phosphatase PrpC
VGFNKNGQGLIVVCDGIGSQDDSQIASLITVEVFKEQFMKHSRVFNVERFFNKCLRNAYNQITEISLKRLNGKKIGTTLVVSLIDKNKVTTFNLGDSRLYYYSLLKNT